jgi:hypothetical protein
MMVHLPNNLSKVVRALSCRGGHGPGRIFGLIVKLLINKLKISLWHHLGAQALFLGPTSNRI